MRIWVDADACPKAIKEILFRAAKRTGVVMILVANQPLSIPLSPFIKKIQVGAGFDVADNRIVQEVTPGDIVITADIPLADLVVAKGCVALNPRGECYTKENIKHCLAMRNLMSELRSSGLVSGGPPTLNTKDHTAFANNLDRLLSRR